MKQFKLLLFFCLAFVVSASAQLRYFDEVFSSVKVTESVTYGVNATVLYLSPPANGLGQGNPEKPPPKNFLPTKSHSVPVNGTTPVLPT